jgi:hypothetical protein
MYRVETAADVARLLQLKLPEGQSLEYKSILTISTRPERRETLKDLTGMGNGGGGTVIYGIEKDPIDDALPGPVQPLTDTGLIGQLDAIVRDGARPPLLSEPRVIDWSGGFLLAIEVLPSLLGPYMVEGYGDHGYHRRANRSTIPMSEREVRDAYALADRWRSSREDIWRQYGLPTSAPGGKPWLTVSAVPEASFHDLIDPATTHPHQLRLPEDQLWILQLANFGADLFQNLRVFSDGYYAEAATASGDVACSIRIMRAGAVGFGFWIDADTPIGFWLPQAVNAQLLLLDWVRRCLALRVPLELEVELHGGHNLHLKPPGQFAREERRALVKPWPHNLQSRVFLGETILPWELASASRRHRLVLRVWDRIHQAYGAPRAPFEHFHIGWLYDMEGRTTNCYLGPGSIQQPLQHLFRVCVDGAMERARDANVVGWVDEGTVYDMEGRAIAATEFAVSVGLPSTYRVGLHSGAPPPDTLTALERHPTGGRKAPPLQGVPSPLSLQDLST